MLGDDLEAFPFWTSDDGVGIRVTLIVVLDSKPEERLAERGVVLYNEVAGPARSLPSLWIALDISR